MICWRWYLLFVVKDSCFDMEAMHFVEKHLLALLPGLPFCRENPFYTTKRAAQPLLWNFHGDAFFIFTPKIGGMIPCDLRIFFNWVGWNHHLDHHFCCFFWEAKLGWLDFGGVETLEPFWWFLALPRKRTWQRSLEFGIICLGENASTHSWLFFPFFMLVFGV